MALVRTDHRRLHCKVTAKIYRNPTLSLPHEFGTLPPPHQPLTFSKFIFHKTLEVPNQIRYFECSPPGYPVGGRESELALPLTA